MPDHSYLTIEQDGVTVACPYCDSGGGVYLRRRETTNFEDLEGTFACVKCTATFDQPEIRETKPRGVDAKYGHLEPEDVGL